VREDNSNEAKLSANLSFATLGNGISGCGIGAVVADAVGAVVGDDVGVDGSAAAAVDVRSPLKSIAVHRACGEGEIGAVVAALQRLQHPDGADAFVCTSDTDAVVHGLRLMWRMAGREDGQVSGPRQASLLRASRQLLLVGRDAVQQRTREVRRQPSARLFHRAVDRRL
jgi:hypothetical protein